MATFLLKEDGGYLLLETGGKIVLDPGGTTPTNPISPGVSPNISLHIDTIAPRMSITKTDAQLADQGYTYNQAGLTYNQTGVMYGGVYNQGQDVLPLFSERVQQAAIDLRVEQTHAQLSDQGYTYNQAGFTYNQPGVTYGGIYNEQEGSIDIVLTASVVEPIHMRIDDIYAPFVPPAANHGIPLGPGFFLFITNP